MSDSSETPAAATSSNPVANILDSDVGALLAKQQASAAEAAAPPAQTPDPASPADAKPSLPFEVSLYRGLALTWGGVMAALSLSPILPDQLPAGVDKIEHFLAYTLLTFLVMRGWAGTRFLFLIFLAVVLYGGALEGLQGLVPGRTIEIMDMLANVAGAVTGLIIATVSLSRRAKQAKLSKSK